MSSGYGLSGGTSILLLRILPSPQPQPPQHSPPFSNIPTPPPPPAYNAPATQTIQTVANAFSLIGPSRCFPFWQEVLACYVVNTDSNDDSGKRKCMQPLEDYYECLHHRKEVRTPFHIRGGNEGRGGRARETPEENDIYKLRDIPGIQATC